MGVQGDEIRSTRRRRKRWDSTTSIAVFSLGFLLIFSRICLLSSAEKISQRWSPARKARFNGHARAPSSPSSSQMVMSTEKKKNNNEELSSSDNLYDEEKRLVHTGPNPLHN